VNKRAFRKPDGRSLILYGGDLEGSWQIPEPKDPAARGRAHLRWHPLRAEWVAYADHRQGRTFLPPPDWDPLAPTENSEQPTELPRGSWKVAVFENRFPSLAPDATEAPSTIVPTRPGRGVCEVVVYTQEKKGSLGTLGLPHLELLIEVWADRTAELGARDDIEYVMPFENRGVEVGATLHHPHGQIYAYPFVPPVAAIELEQQARHFERHGSGLLVAHLERERVDGSRILYDGPEVTAFVPAFARYPYEVWVAPHAPIPALDRLDAKARRDFARALKTVVLKLDTIRDPFPYVMVFHQAPSDGREHPEAHLHAEFYPAYRTPDRLKYLAGTELGAGMFTNDALPEAKAAELNAMPVTLEESLR
jgi:UDPglucose--hexose-1-phosphate uridylyltransferase